MHVGRLSFNQSITALVGAMLCWCAPGVAQTAADQSQTSSIPILQASAPAKTAPRLVHPERIGVRPLAPTLTPIALQSPSFRTRGPITSLRLGDFDTTTFRDEDRQMEGVPGVPLRVGVNRSLPGGPASIDSAGQWMAADGKRIWLFQMEVPGASAVRVHFSRCDLPASARLVVYGADKDDFDVYTGRGPNDKGEFWAAAVPGETVYVEYQAPQDEKQQPVIEIEQISHIYGQSPASNAQAAGLDSISQDGVVVPMSLLSCEQDVNCYSVDSVARDSVGLMEWTDVYGTHLCSGALLADVDPNSYAGYFLTANHCLSTQTAVDSLTVYWFYQTNQCNGTFPLLDTLPKSMGGTLLATNPSSDFTFIRLADDPQDGQGFAAWTTADPVGTVTGIHHPQGTYKRVSFGALTTDSPICSGYPTTDYWYLDWTNGATEEGSSGSPLFNGSWQVVGQLFGGCVNPGKTIGCNNPQDFNIFYGKFSVTYPSITAWLNLVTPDDSYEDNDTLAQAAPITQGTHNLKLVDFDDYFAIASPASGQITVTATYNVTNMTVKLELLQPNGTVIYTSSTASGTEAVSGVLAAGPYVIHLHKQSKWGGDYTLNISLPPAYSDFDRDSDVDMDDFGHLQACFTGSQAITNPSCYDANLNGDNRINAADIAIFNACFFGPNVPATAGCTP